MFVSPDSDPPRARLWELLRLCGGRPARMLRHAGVCIGPPRGRRRASVTYLSEKWLLGENVRGRREGAAGHPGAARCQVGHRPPRGRPRRPAPSCRRCAVTGSRTPSQPGLPPAAPNLEARDRPVHPQLAPPRPPAGAGGVPWRRGSPASGRGRCVRAPGGGGCGGRGGHREEGAEGRCEAGRVGGGFVLRLSQEPGWPWRPTLGINLTSPSAGF